MTQPTPSGTSTTTSVCFTAVTQSAYSLPDVGSKGLNGGNKHQVVLATQSEGRTVNFGDSRMRRSVTNCCNLCASVIERPSSVRPGPGALSERRPTHSVRFGAILRASTGISARADWPHDSAD